MAKKTKPDLQGLLDVQETFGISFAVVERAECGRKVFCVKVTDKVGSNMTVPGCKGNGEYFCSTNRDWTQSSMLRWLKSGSAELRSRLFFVRIPRFSTIEELRMRVAIQWEPNL